MDVDECRGAHRRDPRGLETAPRATASVASSTGSGPASPSGVVDCAARLPPRGSAPGAGGRAVVGTPRRDPATRAGGCGVVAWQRHDCGVAGRSHGDRRRDAGPRSGGRVHLARGRGPAFGPSAVAASGRSPVARERARHRARSSTRPPARTCGRCVDRRGHCPSAGRPSRRSAPARRALARGAERACRSALVPPDRS